MKLLKLSGRVISFAFGPVVLLGGCAAGDPDVDPSTPEGVRTIGGYGSPSSGGTTSSSGGAASAAGGTTSTATGGSTTFSQAGTPNSPMPWKLVPTRETAQELLDRIVALYQAHAAAAYPAGTHEFVSELADDDLPQAHAKFMSDGRWLLYVTSSFLVVPHITLDTLALVACHETGHFVAGFPFKGSSSLAYGTSSAAEPQADYFAAKDCLSRLWADEIERNEAALAEIDASARALCTNVYSDRRSQAICSRILLASSEAAQFFHEAYLARGQDDQTDPPSIATPDATKVEKTADGHETSQCRLDSMVAGALCNVKAEGTGIPGYVPPYGELSIASRDDARPFACQDGPGARPGCWFAPDQVPFDCAPFPDQCVMKDGVPMARSCLASDGVMYAGCQAGELCVSLEGYDYPTCGSPEDSP